MNVHITCQLRIMTPCDYSEAMYKCKQYDYIHFTETASFVFIPFPREIQPFLY